MRPKIIILLSAIACIGGIVFFLACKYTYEFKVTELKEKAKETFTEALDKELKNRNIKEYGAYSELRTNLFLRIVLMALISIGIIGFLYICILQGRFANWIVAIFQKFFHRVRSFTHLYFRK